MLTRDSSAQKQVDSGPTGNDYPFLNRIKVTSKLLWSCHVKCCLPQRGRGAEGARHCYYCSQTWRSQRLMRCTLYEMWLKHMRIWELYDNVFSPAALPKWNWTQEDSHSQMFPGLLQTKHVACFGGFWCLVGWVSMLLNVRQHNSALSMVNWPQYRAPSWSKIWTYCTRF